MLYDLLRPFRVRVPRFTAALDWAYCLTVCGTMFLFLLRRGAGQLRGFIVLGAVGGAVLFFCAFSELLRPVWAFWADTLAFLTGLLCLPLRWTRNFFKKMLRRGKNLFYFWRKCFTIRKSGCRPAKGGGRNGKAKKGTKGCKASDRTFDKTADRNPVGRAGLQGVRASGAGVVGGSRKGSGRRLGRKQASGK